MKKYTNILIIFAVFTISLIIIATFSKKNIENRTAIPESSWQEVDFLNYSVSIPPTYTQQSLSQGLHVINLNSATEQTASLGFFENFEITENKIIEAITNTNCSDITEDFKHVIFEETSEISFTSTDTAGVLIGEMQGCEFTYKFTDPQNTVGETYLIALPFDSQHLSVFVTSKNVNTNEEEYDTLKNIIYTLRKRPVDEILSNTQDENMNTTKNDKYAAQPETLSKEDLTNKKATIKTAKGDIVIELYGEQAPKTVSNFIFLAKEDFYDNLTFHRVEPGFVVQGGDPLGVGTGGPGYQVDAELETGLKHEIGAVAMARLPDSINPEKKSSGSQFYIVTGEASFLDGEYTVFGKVISGMEIVNVIEVGDEILDVVVE